MAKAEIMAGACGFITNINTEMNGDNCSVEIASECAAIQKMAAELKSVNPYQEISFRHGMPSIHEMGTKYCSHAACQVPVGIIKAVEVEAGLALPADVSIKLERGNSESTGKLI